MYPNNRISNPSLFKKTQTMNFKIKRFQIKAFDINGFQINGFQMLSSKHNLCVISRRTEVLIAKINFTPNTSKKITLRIHIHNSLKIENLCK